MYIGDGFYEHMLSPHYLIPLAQQSYLYERQQKYATLAQLYAKIHNRSLTNDELDHIIDLDLDQEQRFRRWDESWTSGDHQHLAITLRNATTIQ